MRQALEMALEALEKIATVNAMDYEYQQWAKEYLAAIKEALAQPEQIQPDKVCIEDDGCPTEKAVLQRFWREHQKTKPEQEPVAWENILGAVARGWCYEENANKTMDSELAVAIAKEVQALYIKE